MLLDCFASLKLLSLEFQLLAYDSIALHNFLGSSLRGAFGESLKIVACSRGSINCAEGCQSESLCPYAYVFETTSSANVKNSQNLEDVPHPYIIVPPALRQNGTLRHFSRGNKLTFGITLIGKACDYLLYVIAAIKDICQGGLGVNRTPFHLSQIYVNRASGKEDFSKLISSYDELPEPDELKSLIERRLTGFGSLTQLKIEFLSPLRLRISRDIHIGRNAEAKVTFELLIKNVIRRFSMLSRFHGKELSREETEIFNEIQKQATSITLTDGDIYWCDIARYSNRQKARLKFGGLMGSLSFTGEGLKNFLPLLLVGEYLSLGSSTTFGLGRVQVLV